MTKTIVLIPAYNEGRVLAQTIGDVKKAIAKLKNTHIVIIDDGSTDNTNNVAKQQKVVVLHHIINRGLGGAISTGLAYAKNQNADIAVTLDADGQHDPSDILKMIKPITSNTADIVIGTRYNGADNQISIDRKILHSLSNLFTLLLYGQKTSDSQSGFRAFNKKALERIEIKTQKMEVSTELFWEIKKHQLKLVEVPIKVIYTNYSKQKGQTNLNSISIIIKLIIRLFR